MKVTVKEGENITSALRRFKKKTKEMGLINELREREAYTKPTTARKKAKASAIARWRKKEAANRLPTKPGSKK